MTAIFDRLLDSLELKVHAFGHCEVHAGWQLAFPPSPNAHVHYVLAGQGRLVVPDQPPIPLHPESFVLIPAGVRGTFSSGDDAVRSLDASLVKRTNTDLQQVIAGSGAANPLSFVCGTVMLDSAGRRVLLDPLGETIASADLEAPFARKAIEQLIAELSAPRSGTRPIVEQLLRLCLLLLLRMQHEEGRYPDWMLGSASTDLLEQVILKLIDMPEGDFSIEELAGLAGMSRSSFLRTFTSTVGQTPSGFVRDLRLKQAARLLATTRRPIVRIASEVGYDSRSHFSKLFKERYGVDPTAYRDQQMPPAASA